MQGDPAIMQAVLEEVRRRCATLPAAEEYIMVHHPAFRLGKKPFVIVGMEEAKKGATLSVNLGRDMQAELLSDTRFARTPYIGQHGWVTIAHRALRKNELAALVLGSYRRVAGKKQLAALDGPRPAAPREVKNSKVTRTRSKITTRRT